MAILLEHVVFKCTDTMKASFMGRCARHSWISMEHVAYWSWAMQYKTLAGNVIV